jgi:glycosyltransferase involved in cell wall biosynthesis
MAEKISVILTVHNDAQHIRKSIESILDQTHANLELIVVDDGSTDGTAELVSQFSDSRLNLVRAGRVGRGKALNAGLAASHGELIAIQDSDDLSHPRRLEVQARALQHNKIDFLGSSAILFEDREPEWPVVDDDVRPPIEVTAELTVANPIPHISLMIRREALEDLGGYSEKRKVLFDYDLYIRAAAKGYHLYRLPISLAGKRIHSGQQFEKGARARYVFEMLRLQRQAISALKKRWWLVPAFPLLFCYRMLPREFRLTIQRRRPIYNAQSSRV